jgi:mRNA-degrading endonuclease RelE of RelBE toxin-antitoxin system
MSFSIKTITAFEKEIKALSKKYPSLKPDFAVLVELLEKNPVTGIPLGKNCFKIRMKISSKTKGKSGGARVITCVKIVKKTVYLIAIYDKSAYSSVSDAELKERLKQIPS